MRLWTLELRWAGATLEAIFPGSRESGLAGIRAMDLDGFLREFTTHLPLRAALGLRLAIWLVALAPLFVLGRATLFARLAAAERERLLEALLASRVYAIRSLVLLLKAVGALLYLADRGVRSHLSPRRPAPGAALVPLRGKGVHVA
ncbi:MAG: hypothetical protein JOZ69_25665 [Myxococcales bacterium]|nr:hypothetical protein [Myxococcales bacterium]